MYEGISERGKSRVEQSEDLRSEFVVENSEFIDSIYEKGGPGEKSQEKSNIIYKNDSL